ncbi:MAG TPA: nickel transporter permease [Candidatus Limnocylindria bacterium]|nr:nickel transporter permease [Candidatus Limnocylindria bacterium]
MATRSELLVESGAQAEEGLRHGGRPGVLRALVREPTAVAGLAIVLGMALVAIAAPVLAPADPAAVDGARRLLPPSLEHPLGTDNLGRDVLSRIMWGARLSLGTAALATTLILTIGVGIGLAVGYYGGLLDDVVMRVVDVILAFPALILALAIVGVLGAGIGSVMIGVVSVAWADYARVMRGLVLAARERQYVEAARAVGARDLRIVLRHVAPNVLAPVIVLASLEMGGIILAVSALSFLGLGAQPPTPEWGAMLNDGRPFIFAAPQLMVYPGVAISLVVIGFNLLGDGLRDVLDPHTRRG